VTLAAQEAMSDPVRRGDLREPDGVDPGFGTLAAATGPSGLLGSLDTPPPQALADRMRDAWVGFASDGDPGWPEGPEPHRIDA
jgi:hypothetical protein